MPKKKTDTTIGLLIGLRLRALRKKLNFTQKQFASMMGVIVQVYQRYEKGTLIPGSDKIIKLLEHLKSVNPSWLLTGQGPMFIEGEIKRTDKEIQFFTKTSKRLSQLREHLHLSPDEFANKLGIDSEDYIAYETGKPLGIEVLYKIKEAIPHLNLNWLISGWGPMFLQEDIAILPIDDKDKELVIAESPESYEKGDYVVIPYHEKAKAFIESFDFPDKPLTLPKEYLKSFFRLTFFDGLSLIPVTGKSMEPTIPNKSLAIVRDQRFESSVWEGMIYAIIVNNIIHVKRVYFYEGKMCLVNDNPDIPGFEITQNDKVHIIGRVVGCISFVEVG